MNYSKLLFLPTFMNVEYIYILTNMIIIFMDSQENFSFIHINFFSLAIVHVLSDNAKEKCIIHIHKALEHYIFAFNRAILLRRFFDHDF